MKKVCFVILAFMFFFASCSINSIEESSTNVASSFIQDSEIISSENIEQEMDLIHEPNISFDYKDCKFGDKIENFDSAQVDYNIEKTISKIKDNIIENSTPLAINEVYTAKDIMYAWNNWMFNMGGDFAAWLFHGSIVYNGDARVLLTYFAPENSRFYKDKYYCAYEIKDYGRLYFYFSDINGFESPVGYPMLISKKMKLSDFAEIQPGSSIYKVIDIDKSTELYYAQYVLSKVNSENVKYSKEAGKTVCSLHYLDEGILRIEYDVLDNGEFIVDDLVLIEDYIFTDYKGRTFDLSIMEEDLPFSKEQ